MSFYKWMVRKGTPGQTARTIAQQYKALKQSNPSATNGEIFESILDLRNSAMPYPEHWPMKGFKQQLKENPSISVISFVSQLVQAEADVLFSELGKRGEVIRDVIREELERSGIKS
jgi:hypothetical protein